VLTAIARFEFRYLLRNPLVWLTAAVTFAAFVVGLGAGLEFGSEGGLLVNAAYATLKNYLVVSIFYMFVTTAFVANAVIRDDETGFGPIVRSTRITKADYVIGRFIGAFAIAALCLLVLPVGLTIGTLIADPATVGPNRLVHHLYGYFLVALPNILIHSAIFFALATITRSMMATYLGVIGLVSGFVVLDTAFGDRPQLQTMIALADPFGARPLTDVARYWTVAERNVSLPDFAGVLLYNRLLWIGIALLALALANVAFRFADSGISKREQKKQRLAERSATAESASEARAAVLATPAHGPAAQRAMLWKRTRFEARQVALSPAFVVLMAWMLLTTLITLLSQRDPDGKPTYPTTLSMIPELENGLGFVPLIIAIFYAGELVWRERSRRMHEIIDATPMPSWTYVVSKTLAMTLVLVTILLATVVASVIVQLSLGYTELEVGKYLLWYVLPRAWDMVLIAALAVFVQAVSPHKAVGWAVLVLFIMWKQLDTGVEHNLLSYAGSSAVPLSDMNGAGDFWKAAWVFRVYWGAFALLMLLAAHLLWRRGSETRIKPRIALARRRLRGEAGMVGAAALLTFLAAGGYAFYNTNVLNEYRSNGETEADAVEFEKKFGKYGDMPQPAIEHLRLEVALFPEERRATAKGRYRLRNKTVESIQEVHIRTFGEDLELVRSTIGGARLVSSDMKHRYHIFRLDRPMLPGEDRTMDFETRYTLRGFRNQPTSTRLVDNGTFLNEVHLTPRLGAARAGLLQDPAKRRKYGLPQISPAPKLEDLAATARPAIGRGWGTTDITVSTSADQTPLAPGNKVSDVTRGGRRIARFVSGAPVHTRFAIQSARYAEKHRQHAGVDLAVYYHPAHSWNVDRMLDALAASLDYYQANFGPYQFDHARIVEFPGYLDFAQAFGGTIPYSEEVGFVSDYTTPDAMDYVTYLTAHEFAHQYWAHQVAGADMEGRELLSETLSQYSAQMVLKKIRGKDHMRRYMQFELDRYLEGRANGLEEPPLIRVSGQDYVTYRKGALAMFLLQERLGEDAINRALRSLVNRYRFKDAPFPRSLDLVAALRAEAKTEEDQNLITDLFERIPLYQLEVGEPTAVRRADGKWEVTVPVDAKKFYADGKGAETEAPLNERIEVGLFTALPGRDAFDEADVVLLERFPIRSGRQFFRFITDRKPTHAGIDPYNYYIDRSSADNVAAVQ
jgi:ABC-type transport system involved in multi-copper enzyme maturation permease subunit